MNLKLLTDEKLITATERLVQQEQELLINVLRHLREIDRRRLYSQMKYESLFDFTSRHLKYPGDQAYRRIAAMRMLKDLPELEQQIADGGISLTHIGIAHSLFKQEQKLNNREMPKAKKMEVFMAIANKPVREAERITHRMSSQPMTLTPDRVKLVSDEHIEIKFTAPIELQKKLETLKGLLAHKNPMSTMAELIDQLADLALKEWNPAKPVNVRKLTHTNQSQIHREVWAKANNQCDNCGSSHALEIDHIYPKAWGGTDDADNLRLLCRNCNQRAAIKTIGQNKMEQFLG